MSPVVPKPCSMTTAGPWPPTRTWMDVPLVSIVRVCITAGKGYTPSTWACSLIKALRYVCESVILFSFVASSVCCRSALHHVERNLDVAPRSVGICTCLAVRGVRNGLGDFALQTRQADIKPRSEEVNVARMAQVYFGIDGYVCRKRDLHPVGHKPHRTNETGGPTSGKQLLRIGASSWDTGSREVNT